jgi:hypothetical protein
VKFANRPVVKSKLPANFPFLVEFQNVFGNWVAVSGHKTEDEAQDAAEQYSLTYCTVANSGPLRIRHYTGGPM